ncbi:multicopper oxidase family protein [Streptomyces sp. NPDC048172]|uniref:multicopper oxidase family protein n=1 Tax=Streptomyces sp. NPDC048172 TaxID=3365505 RepID=UPI0037235A88
MKRILLVLGALVAVVALLLGGGFLWLWNDARISTVGEEDFTDELAIPPLAKSRVAKDGTRVFDLRMRKGTKEFRPGRPTPTWGFNQSYLGPTLRVERGEKVRVRVRNGLDEASSVHWHGMHLPARMDGGPHQPVRAGATWTPHWKVDQPASTLWYHPHPHGRTEKHVQRGLAGMFLLDDEKSRKLALPKRYGVDDLPLIVQDVKFDGNRFDHGHKMMRNVGFLGDRTMVNGTLSPYRTVKDERVRLRLLNASTARSYHFGFDDDRDFALVGTDGGLLERPDRMNRVKLSPGERAEIVVRMRPGERTVLRGYEGATGGDSFQRRFSGDDDSFDVLQLRAARTLRSSPAVPAELGALEVPKGENPARKRRFTLRMGQINGKEMDMKRVDATVTRGTEEVWSVRNEDMPHNFHVHDVQFRVLEIDGRRPTGTLRGPKDTVFIPVGSTAKLAMRFVGPSDPKTPYMFHCHLLYHEDLGMMGQFTVVEPGGRKAARVPGAGGGGGHAHHH